MAQYPDPDVVDYARDATVAAVRDRLPVDGAASDARLELVRALLEAIEADQANRAAEDTLAALSAKVPAGLVVSGGALITRGQGAASADAQIGTGWQAGSLSILNVAGTLDRLRGVEAAHATTGLGLLGVAPLIHDGSNYRRQRAANLADGQNGGDLLAHGGYVLNSVAQWERARAAPANGSLGNIGVASVAAGVRHTDSSYYALNAASAGGDGDSGQRILTAALAGWNGATFDRIRALTGVGDGQSPPGAGILAATAYGMLYDPAAAAWSRLRGSPQSGSTTPYAGILGSAVMLSASSGASTNYHPQARASATGDAHDGSGAAVVSTHLFNGSTFDREHGNTAPGTVLASAARTATTDSPVQTNKNGRGLAVMLNVSAIGTGSVQLQVRAVDHTGATALVAQSAVITTAGAWLWEVYPGVVAGAGNVGTPVSAAVPRSYIVRVVHSDGSSWTYSLGVATML